MLKHLFLAACLIAATVTSFGQSNTSYVCHVTKSGVRLMYVSLQALDAHLKHGDYLVITIDQNAPPTCDLQ